MIYLIKIKLETKIEDCDLTSFLSSDLLCVAAPNFLCCMKEIERTSKQSV